MCDAARLSPDGTDSAKFAGRHGAPRAVQPAGRRPGADGVREASMTTSRARPTGTRRTRLPAPLPGCAAAIPGRLPAPARRGSKRLARAAAVAFAVTVLLAAGLAKRAALAASLTVLGHLHWIWIPVTVVLESASMMAFAIMLRRLLAAGGAKVGVRPMLATALAANALSVSVPLAGPELATAFTFRRFTRQGADAALAGWSLLAGGVVSSAAAALVLVGGGLASGKILVTAVAVPGAVLAVAVLAVSGRGIPPAAAARRTGAARGLDATARVQAAPPARRAIPARRSGSGPNGWAHCASPRRAG